MTVTQYNALPQFDQSFIEGGKTSRAWYQFLANIWTGKPPQIESVLHAASSPFTYVASRAGFLIVQGGTVSLVSWTRSTPHNTGQTQGLFPMSQGDTIVITYSSAPNLTFAPI